METVEQSPERKFGGFPLSIVDGRALGLTVVSPCKECQPSELTIDSATALVLEQQTLRSASVGNQHITFPCTRNEWYKYIFWPVHANGGDHSCLHYGLKNTAPYSQLAIKMRLPKQTNGPVYSRGSTTFQRPLHLCHESYYLTSELCAILNNLEVRTAPLVRLRLQYASLSAYQRIGKPTLSKQSQSATVATPTPTSVSTLPLSAMHVIASIGRNQQQSEPT